MNKGSKLTTAWGWGTTLALLVLGLALLLFIKPAMPSRVVLLTGPEASAYYDLGIRYADELRKRGLEVEVVATSGALDNVKQIANGKTAIGLAPSAVDWEREAELDTAELVTLGSVGVQPLWLFFRSELSIKRLPDLAGMQVMTEGEGSAGQHVVELLIEKNELQDRIQLRPLEQDKPIADLVSSLRSGEVDAFFVTGHPSTIRIRALLHADGLQFMSFDRADAYAAQIRGITKLRVPEGMFDLARNVPERDSQLLSKTNCLVTNDHLHPAIVPMFLTATENVRQSEMTFPGAPAFPSSEHVTLPLHPAAKRFFRQGEVGLSQYLPYQVTRFINHLGFFVLPLLSIGFVAVKAVPLGLRLWSSFRFRRLFRQLEEVEKRHAAGEDGNSLMASIDRISDKSAAMYVPLSLSQDYVDFRQFVHDMRERVQGSEGGTPAED